MLALWARAAGGLALAGRPSQALGSDDQVVRDPHERKPDPVVLARIKTVQRLRETQAQKK